MLAPPRLESEFSKQQYLQKGPFYTGHRTPAAFADITVMDEWSAAIRTVAEAQDEDAAMRQSHGILEDAGRVRVRWTGVDQETTHTPRCREAGPIALELDLEENLDKAD